MVQKERYARKKWVMTDQGTGGGLVALVVTQNRLEQLQRTIERLLQSPPQDLRAALVFDNASSEDTRNWLRAQNDPRLHVINSPVNLGGAGGFEAAMRAAMRDLDPDWLVLMDDDGRPDTGAIAAFQARPKDGFDAIAAAVRMPGGQISEMNRPWINPFRTWRDLAHALRHGREGFHLGPADYAPDAPIREIDGASFVGFFISRAGVARAGLPDGRLFLYGDDVLYSLRLRRAGGRIGFDPGLGFEHDCTTLPKSGPPILNPLWKAYYFHRNQVLITAQAAGPLLFWPALALRALQWVMRARHYGAQARSYRRLLWTALRDGLRRDLTRSHEDVVQMAWPRMPVSKQDQPQSSHQS